MIIYRHYNAAARLLTQTKRRDHITPILEELHWLPVSSGIQYKVLLIALKILHHKDSPRYLKELLSLRVPSRGLRSSDDPWLLAIPRSKGDTWGPQSRCYGSQIVELSAITDARAQAHQPFQEAAEDRTF
jgi:hypothetical protein